MSIDQSGKGYIMDPLYQKEGIEFGATMAFSPGAHLAGFSDPNDPGQIARFASYQRPDGTPMLRKHGDRERMLQIQIGSVPKEFNAKLSTASPGEFLTAAHCAVEAAIEADREVLEPRMLARAGAGGKTKVGALPLAHYTAHGTNRSGKPMLHVHCARLKAGRTEGGEIHSLADNRMPYQKQREWDRQFQLRLADKVENLLGWKMEMRNGKATPTDVHPALVAAQGGRRREMKAHLDARGIPHTPAAMAVAALATQPTKLEWKLLERHVSWKREAAEQVRQWDQRQAPAASRADGQAKVRADAPKAAATPPRPDPAAQTRPKPQPGPAQKQNGQGMGPAGPGQFVLSNRSPGPKAQPQQGQAKPSPKVQAGQGQQQKQGPQQGQAQPSPKAQAGQVQGQQGPVQQAAGRGYATRPGAGQAPQPRQQEKGRWGRIADGLAKEIRLQGRVVKEAWKCYRAKGEREGRVSNVGHFLEDTRKRTRIEGHLAAIRELRRTQASSLKEALSIAQRGNKKGREPVLKLDKGAKVVIRHDAPAMTGGEFRTLQSRAEKNGWDLRLCGHHARHLKAQGQQAQVQGQQAQGQGQGNNQGQQAAGRGYSTRRRTP